ncbi:hypothetical protein Hanom_Chr04g00331431 [Helianthus anomalus]
MKATSTALAACLMICVSTLINSLCSSKIGYMCVEFQECLVTDVTFSLSRLGCEVIYLFLSRDSFVDSVFDSLVIRNCFRWFGCWCNVLHGLYSMVFGKVLGSLVVECASWFLEKITWMQIADGMLCIAFNQPVLTQFICGLAFAASVGGEDVERLTDAIKEFDSITKPVCHYACQVQK